MKIKHNDITIPADNPFEHCKLDRKKYADALTSVVAGYKNGFVLSINNPWGTGKTTFIKMWQAQLTQLTFRTLYFNAWENDFDRDPLVAIMSELNTLRNKKNEKLFTSVIQKAAVISKNIAPGLVKAIIGKHLDSEILLDAIKGTTESATEIFKEEIDNYAKKKKGLIEFREDLEKYIKAHNDGKPLVFIIDELDRCRPDYAVEVLEQIKHFFNVPGIVFVLSIDKVQLGNAVRGFYGSERIESNEYLRRFIDLEFSLPPPESGVFARYLFEYFDFDTYFKAPERSAYRELQEDSEAFIHFAIRLFSVTGLTLRQQEKVFSAARTILNTFTINNYLFPSIFILLIYIKDFRPDFYSMLMAKDTPYQNIIDELAQVFPKNIDHDDEMTFLVPEVTLLLMYQNSLLRKGKLQQLTEKNEQNKDTLLVKSCVDATLGGSHFLGVLETLRRKGSFSVSIDHLINKINLMESFKTDLGLPS
ncbi:P-loop NTPase fold protein [Pedobacter sp. KBW01]|uniref:KAP family P-loop NTPase fold protein n=1 Tax=Pedobacter sp. KBW01 TaxID=2153364 RepID=UPI001319CAAC|nr:P-loop NTPase fold protein [Pedobacter sp. KBW01]